MAGAQEESSGKAVVVMPACRACRTSDGAVGAHTARRSLREPVRCVRRSGAEMLSNLPQDEEVVSDQGLHAGSLTIESRLLTTPFS